jgi:lysophospholipase L1-like esterase
MATFREIQTRDDPQLGRGAGGGASGLRRALLVLAVGLPVLGLPYLVPGLEAYRPWTRQAGIPFLELLRGSAGPIVAEAGGGISSSEEVTSQEQELLAFAGDPADEREEAGGGEAAAPPRGAARQRFAGLPGGLEVEIPPKDYAKVKVRLEDPRGAMRPFYEALARTARKEPGAVTRISHFGDSATAPDKITAVTRLLLQRRFGDAGLGFVLAAPATRWYAHAGLIYRAANWQVRRITHGNARDKRYGLGGVRAIGGPDAHTFLALHKGRKVGSAVSRFDVYYLRGPGQGKLRLRVDRAAPQLVSAAAETWQDALHTIRVEDGTHRLRLGVERGRVSVYGVVLERDGPGVVYDNLGLVGYYSKRVLFADAQHLKAQLAFRKPDLMVLMYGGNYLAHKFWNPERYERFFARSVAYFRKARPGAACLVISPLDHGEKHEGVVRTIPKLPSMVAVQRKVALANNCAFYDLFEAMGGKGTMARWVATRPRLAIPDMAHVTRHGARLLGGLVYRALMAGFVEHLGGKRRR